MKTTEKNQTEFDLIRFQIDNTDSSISEEKMKSIIETLSKYTLRLSKKYKIADGRFKLITGRNFFEKVFRNY